MVRATIIAAIALVLAICCVRTDATARGGGFHMGGFHGAHFGGWWGGGARWGWGHFQGHGFHARAFHDHDFHGHDFHDHGPHDHGFHPHDVNGPHFAHDGFDGHGAPHEQGRWFRSAGFGDMRAVTPRLDGQWHRSSGFGDDGHMSARLDGELHGERRPAVRIPARPQTPIAPRRSFDDMPI